MIGERRIFLQLRSIATAQEGEKNSLVVRSTRTLVRSDKLYRPVVDTFFSKRQRRFRSLKRRSERLESRAASPRGESCFRKPRRDSTDYSPLAPIFRAKNSSSIEVFEESRVSATIARPLTRRVGKNRESLSRGIRRDGRDSWRSGAPRDYFRKGGANRASGESRHV